MEVEPASESPKGTFKNCYNCLNSGLQQQCFGCCCLSCQIGNNAAKLRGREYWEDCAFAFIFAENSCGPGLMNMKQREVLDANRGDELGSFICSPCVACETARLIELERKSNDLRGVLEPLAGLTEHRLLEPVTAQPKALQVSIKI